MLRRAATRMTSHPMWTRARRRINDGDNESGSTAVEFVICAALMVFMLLAIVQFAVYFHLRSVATTAARHGVDRVRVVNGSEALGVAATNEFLDQAGRSLEGRSVGASRSATISTVTVTGQVVAVIPGFAMHLTVTANAPTERVEP
jgi:Flp pilus assembly protein TadG